jgi:transglutaminase-like putative cysteine protease
MWPEVPPRQRLLTAGVVSAATLGLLTGAEAAAAMAAVMLGAVWLLLPLLPVRGRLARGISHALGGSLLGGVNATLWIVSGLPHAAAAAMLNLILFAAFLYLVRDEEGWAVTIQLPFVLLALPAGYSWWQGSTALGPNEVIAAAVALLWIRGFQVANEPPADAEASLRAAQLHWLVPLLLALIRDPSLPLWWHGATAGLVLCLGVGAWAEGRQRGAGRPRPVAPLAALALGAGLVGGWIYALPGLLTAFTETAASREAGANPPPPRQDWVMERSAPVESRVEAPPKQRKAPSSAADRKEAPAGPPEPLEALRLPPRPGERPVEVVVETRVERQRVLREAKSGEAPDLIVDVGLPDLPSPVPERGEAKIPLWPSPAARPTANAFTASPEPSASAPASRPEPLVAVESPRRHLPLAPHLPEEEAFASPPAPPTDTPPPSLPFTGEAISPSLVEGLSPPPPPDNADHPERGAKVGVLGLSNADLHYADEERIELDDRPVPIGELVPPVGATPPKRVYLRAFSYDQLTATGFRPAPVEATAARTASRAPAPAPFAPARSSPAQRWWHLRLVEGAIDWIPLPSQFSFLEAHPATDLSWSLHHRGVRRDLAPPVLEARFQQADFGPRFAASGTEDRETLVSLFGDAALDTRLRALSLEVAGRAGMAPERFARRAVDFLQARARYRLATSLPPGPEPALFRWLESGADGYCEHFAGAFVLLARAYGIPSRAVAGYALDEYDAARQRYLVFPHNAHAWAEILVDGEWLRVEPTPPSNLFRSRGTGWQFADFTLEPEMPPPSRPAPTLAAETTPVAAPAVAELADSLLGEPIPLPPATTPGRSAPPALGLSPASSGGSNTAALPATTPAPSDANGETLPLSPAPVVAEDSPPAAEPKALLVATTETAAEPTPAPEQVPSPREMSAIPSAAPAVAAEVVVPPATFAAVPDAVPDLLVPPEPARPHPSSPSRRLGAWPLMVPALAFGVLVFALLRSPKRGTGPDRAPRAMPFESLRRRAGRLLHEVETRARPRLAEDHADERVRHLRALLLRLRYGPLPDAETLRDAEQAWRELIRERGNRR